MLFLQLTLVRHALNPTSFGMCHYLDLWNEES